MTEIDQSWFWLGAMLLSTISGLFWVWAGRDQTKIPSPFNKIKNRIWGRIIAPLFFSSGVICISLLYGSFNWWFLLALVTYKIVSHLGYGGNTLWTKILRRTIWSVAWLLASLPFCLVSSAWPVFLLQGIVGIASANILGVINPLDAPLEEGVIKFSNIVLVPFMVMV